MSDLGYDGLNLLMTVVSGCVVGSSPYVLSAREKPASPLSGMVLIDFKA
jgi:hypothetical protein